MIEDKQISFLQKKSIESFLLAIEIFNKPTINYRLEGCVFFLSNAWELLLKAKLLVDGESIKYPKKEDRTLTLADCVAKVMTNDKDPIRINLNVIYTLRNSATHYIIPEFEIKYIPFLAFNVRAYAKKLYEYFNINISDYIKTDFLSLFTVNTTKANADILGLYGEEISTIFNQRMSELDNLVETNGTTDIALGVQVNLVRINNKAEADVLFYSTKNPKDPNIKTVIKPVNPNETHTLTYHNVIDEIDAIIKRENIPFTPIKKPEPTARNKNPKIFTSACFDTLANKYGLKENEKYCVEIEYGKNYVYKYSNTIITKIIALILEDKDVVIKARQKK